MYILHIHAQIVCYHQIPVLGAQLGKNDGCGKVDELRRNVSGLDGRSKLAHTVFLVYGGQQMLASGNLT
jgi:hypothetical protein